MLESITLININGKNEGEKEMNKEYGYVQKEVDKILDETNKEKSYKQHQEMKTDQEYKLAIKKIDKLLLKLEK